MKTVKLITCNDAMKAHILQGALENEGIESILHNENFSTLYKSCVSNIAGVDILVADEDYENAVQVLRDNDSWPEELTLCPYCGSSDIQLVLRKGKRWRAMGRSRGDRPAGQPLAGSSGVRPDRGMAAHEAENR